METTDGLSKRALNSPAKFNGEFLWLLVICGLLSILFLFYFNRVFAQIISVFARLYLRSIGDPHYINIESIQISPLAGRFFFGRITYHGPNETITVINGHVTWRYWLRRVRHVTAGTDKTTQINDNTNDKQARLPCRLLVELKGVEWFVYNRAAVYENVVQAMDEQAKRQNTTQEATQVNCGNDRPSTPTEKSEPYMKEDGKHVHPPKTGSTTIALGSSHQRVIDMSSEENFKDSVACSWYLQMLPIKVECNKGALVMGNKNTPSILVAEFDKASGTIDATKSRSIDLYKQIYDISFTHPVVHLKPNADFKESLLARGQRLENSNYDIPSPNRLSQRRNRRQKVFDLLPIFSRSIESIVPSDAGIQMARDGVSSQNQWLGLSRYLDNSEQQNGRKSEPTEYARETVILECDNATFSYWYDIAGKVPFTTSEERGGSDYLNGSPHPPPEYGINLNSTNSKVSYGPWADRQRIHLQNMFFPKSYISPLPAKSPLPGQTRLYTELKLFVELSGPTKIRIPIREASKDWKFKRHLDDGETRPYGWINLKVENESTINYSMDMYPSRNGWNSSMNLELRNPKVSSSVNHELLWEAESQTLECDLSSPLIWNSDTKWTFNNTSKGMRVWILRDHVTLLTDLVTDWTAGPAAEYWTFVPMIYELNLALHDSQFFFNVNEQNIISNPNSFEDNTFLILRNLGADNGFLSGCVNMDFREFRPRSSTVEFLVKTISIVNGGGAVDVGVETPLWNTWNSSLKNRETLGKVGQVMLKGSYEFFSDASPELIDTLTLDLDGDELELTLHGFLIRYFLTIKENYFGENMHFKTLDESRNPTTSVPIDPNGLIKSNDIDIILGVKAERIRILLPKNIYGAKEYVKFGLPSLDLDMRFTNYYMDLQINLSPISGFLGCSLSTSPEIFVNGLTIFGHRLFGLPPTEPTYVCNWDIDVGSITGECSLEFLHTSVFALKAFAFSFTDAENALPLPAITVIHDVTFLRLNVAKVSVWCHISQNAVLRLSADEVALVLNDLADENHSERVNLRIPGLHLLCIDPSKKGPKATTAYLDTGINFTLLGRKNNASEFRRLQQEHIHKSDNRTRRAQFFLMGGDNKRRMSIPGEETNDDTLPATMPLPSLPSQLVFDFRSDGQYPDSVPRTSLGHRSSRSFVSRNEGNFPNRTGSMLGAPSSHDASSFHSAVESFSDLAPATPKTHTFSSSASPAVTTPGSGYSNDPSRRRKNKISVDMTPHPLDVALSSAFIRPNFPLDNYKPDLSRVPSFVSDGLEDHSITNGASEALSMILNDESARDSLIIDMPPGVRGYCTPSSIMGIAILLERFDPETPDDILDMIQIEVVSKLKKLVKIFSPHSTALELFLRVPHLKLCFLHACAREDLSTGQIFESKDSIYIELRNLVVSGRNKKEIIPAHPEETLQKGFLKSSTLHVVVDSLDIGLKNGMESAKEFSKSSKPALGILLESLIFWASSSGKSTASLQIGSIATSVKGDEVLFLYDAGIRLAEVAERISQTFVKINANKNSRIQQFVLDLAREGEKSIITQDPATITRPLTFASDASNHVRHHDDSWKISIRLRHVWQSLSEEAHGKWIEKVSKSPREKPNNARYSFIEVIERWRPWEWVSVKDSVMIRHLFGSSVCTSIQGSTQSLELGVKLKIGRIDITVDPGPSQHEFAIDQFTCCIITGNGNADDLTYTSVVGKYCVNTGIAAQIHMRDIRLGVRLEVLEIVENVFEGLSKRKKSQPEKSSILSRPSQEPEGGDRPKRFDGVHLVITTDHGSISLDTANLTVSFKFDGCNSSAVICEKSTEFPESKRGLIGSLMLGADYGTTQVCYGNKVLSEVTIRTPSLYLYFDEHSFAETEFNMWKATGSSEEITFEVHEQVLGLMEVLDIVVNDEISQIHQFMANINHFQPSKQKPAGIYLTKRTVHTVYGTFSLEQFTLSANLLPSLSYLVRGGGAKLSVNPDAEDSSEFVIGFELEHHEHEVRTSTRPETRIISLLRLPTIKATTRYKGTGDRRSLDIRVSVQAITLEASAIQSLLNALNKPEVVKVIESARLEWIGIDAKLGEILESSKKKRALKEAPGPLLKYRASAGVSGLKIQTYAPSANLEINFGYIQANASNHSNRKSYPDLALEFGKIKLELTRNIQGNLKELCGYLEIRASLETSMKQSEESTIRIFNVRTNTLKIDLYANTASTVVDVIGHLQDKLRDLDLSREVKYLRKLRASNSKPLLEQNSKEISSSPFSNTQMSISMNGIQVAWIVGGKSDASPGGKSKHKLVLSFKKIDFTTMTRKDSEAQLVIEEFLLQMDRSETKKLIERSENSALLPKVKFGVTYSTKDSEINLTFQAKGEPLDLRLTSSCVAAANEIESSISTATQKFRDASANWKSTPTQSGVERKSMFGSKRLGSLSVDADFAGAVVYLSGRSTESASLSRSSKSSQGRRYASQFAQGEYCKNTVLRSPGLAFKIRYFDSVDDTNDPCLNAEINISASTNILYPTVVPLILEMSKNVQEVMKAQRPEAETEKLQNVEDTSDAGSTASSDPAAILGKCRLNIGFRIRPQEFTLSCEPIAIVAASAKFEGIYITVNTCDDEKAGGRFYTISATISGLRASLQHIYSRESAGNLEVKTVVLSLMNNKHLVGSQGISCILKFSPIKSQINVKQFQDFLLFREIWVPAEIREKKPEPAVSAEGPSTQLVQKYHEVTAAKAFPSNTTIVVEELELQLDLSQSLGKSKLLISNLWATSRKSSDWEQTMHLGFDSIRAESIGRLSGFIDLKDMKMRTSINWDSAMDALQIQVPQIEAAVGFKQLQAKISYDYYTFLIADITSFDFLMYNKLQEKTGSNKRADGLVVVLDGDKVQVFCTTVSAAHGLQVYQVFQKLVQEKAASLKEVLKQAEGFLNTQSSQLVLSQESPLPTIKRPESPNKLLGILSLHSDVMVNLKEVHIGAFSNGFYDNQVFKLEALNSTARFAAEMYDEKIKSILQMTLGHLAVAVSPVKHQKLGTNADVDLHDVINAAISSKGGIILKVPQVQAEMETLHAPDSNTIDYTFKSAFEGQVDVGWNFSRVTYIKGMWQKHVKEVAQQQGKTPFSSRISLLTDATPNSPTLSESPTGSESGGSPRTQSDDAKEKGTKDEKDKKGKITAVVNVPQSKYEYKALKPPIIETPQLRDMGEATPPLEWIGLHRERLPNLTHQIVIMPLLEVAKKVEDSYSKILGSS